MPVEDPFVFVSLAGPSISISSIGPFLIEMPCIRSPSGELALSIAVSRLLGIFSFDLEGTPILKDQKRVEVE